MESELGGGNDQAKPEFGGEEVAITPPVADQVAAETPLAVFLMYDIAAIAVALALWKIFRANKLVAVLIVAAMATAWLLTNLGRPPFFNAVVEVLYGFTGIYLILLTGIIWQLWRKEGVLGHIWFPLQWVLMLVIIAALVVGVQSGRVIGHAWQAHSAICFLLWVMLWRMFWEPAREAAPRRRDLFRARAGKGPHEDFEQRKREEADELTAENVRRGGMVGER